MVMLQTGPGLPVFELRLRNTGDHDLVVNIGMLAGTKQYPEAFHFFLLDASGTAYQLLRKGSLAGIAGRIAPLIVALPVEASFSFPVDLALYCSFAEGCPLRLTPSRYTIKADYYSSDQQDLEMFHIWKDRLQAPAIPFVVESNRHFGRVSSTKARLSATLSFATGVAPNRMKQHPASRF
jgi:hypothetical protein